MKTHVITAIAISALLGATMPAQSADAKAHVTKPQLVSKGQRLSSDEIAFLETKSKASERSISKDAGGEENTGTIILAVIGALALLGVLVAASQKDPPE